MFKADLLRRAAFRHARFYLDWLATANTLFRTGGDGVYTAVNRFNEHWLQIRQGRQWAVDHADDPLALELLASYPEKGADLLRLRQHKTDYILWLEAGLAAANTQDQTRTRMMLLHLLGAAYLTVGRTDESRAYAEESLKLAEQLGDAGGALTALTVLGNIATQTGRYADARGLYERAVSLAEQLGDDQGLAVALNNLGALMGLQHDHAASRHYVEGALAIQRRIGNRYAIAGNLNNLGSTAWRQGDYAAAEAYYRESLELRRALGDDRGVADTLNNLGAALSTKGDFEGAFAALDECLRISRTQGIRRLMAYALSNLAAASQELGRNDAALDYYRESVAIFRESSNRYGIAHGLCNLALLQVSLHREIDSARASLVEGLAIAHALGVGALMLVGLIGMAHLRLLDGDGIGAAELAGLIAAQPDAADHEVSAPLALLSVALQDALTPEQVEAARVRGAAMQLEAAVGALLGQTVD